MEHLGVEDGESMSLFLLLEEGFFLKVYFFSFPCTSDVSS